MSSRASDLVRDSQLNTRFIAGAIQHVYYLSSSTARRRRIRTEETWRRQRELGNGTFGRVWLEGCVSGSKQGQLRAVKEISKDGASTTIDYGRELEAIAKFSHGNYVHCFVKSYGWYETSDAVFIAMEYLEHGDLQKHLTGPLPEVEAKEISSQLVEGLVFMHDNGFAHRDLKPGNILVLQPGPEWWVKISDFGISKRAEEENTALRTLIGTEGYLAPELKGFVTADDAAQNDSNHPSYTFAVDVWSLGEIIFRMMSHEAAFRNPRDLFNYVVYSRPFPVEPLRKNSASEDCVDFVTKCMSASPRSRPTATEAVSHIWIQISRPGSRSSSRGSEVASEVATTVASNVLTEDTPLQSPSYQSSYTASSTSLNPTAQWSTGSWQDNTSMSLQYPAAITPTRSLSPAGTPDGADGVPPRSSEGIMPYSTAGSRDSLTKPAPGQTPSQWVQTALTQQPEGLPVRLTNPPQSPLSRLESRISLMQPKLDQGTSQWSTAALTQHQEWNTNSTDIYQNIPPTPLLRPVVTASEVKSPIEAPKRKPISLSTDWPSPKEVPQATDTPYSERTPVRVAKKVTPPPLPPRIPLPPKIMVDTIDSRPNRMPAGRLQARTPLHLSNIVALIVLIRRVAHIRATWRDHIKHRNAPQTLGLQIHDEEERVALLNQMSDPKRYWDYYNGDLRKDYADVWKMNSETARLVRMAGFKSGTALDSIIESSTNSYYLEYIQREMAGCITQLAKRGSGKEVVAVKMAEYPQAFVLRQEAKCLLRLNHPCIIRIIDIVKWTKGFALVYPSEPSADLDQLCRFQYGISEDDTLHVFKQLLSAVKYLQEQGIAHTKLTPHSILARRDSNDKITIIVTDLQDWMQIGASTSGNGSEIGGEEVVKFTAWERLNYAFLPPERWMQNGYTASVYTDMWSCGLILANMLELVPLDGLSATRPKQYVFCTLKYHITEVLLKHVLSSAKSPENPRIRQALKSSLELVPERRMLVRDLYQHLFTDVHDFYSGTLSTVSSEVPHELHTLRQSSSRSFQEKRLSEYLSTVSSRGDDSGQPRDGGRSGLLTANYGHGNPQVHNLAERPASSLGQTIAAQQNPHAAMIRPSRSSVNLSAHAGIYVQNPETGSIPWNQSPWLANLQ